MSNLQIKIKKSALKNKWRKSTLQVYPESSDNLKVSLCSLLIQNIQAVPMVIWQICYNIRYFHVQSQCKFHHSKKKSLKKCFCVKPQPLLAVSPVLCLSRGTQHILPADTVLLEITEALLARPLLSPGQPFRSPTKLI